jgi:hypothetical protein
MSELSRFNLKETDGFREFQGWIEAIEDWGSTYLLPVIKIALRQLLKNSTTPPISPMPSLTLSIDTAAGTEEVLMKVLRATFGSIKWKCDGEYETPLNSSVAHCGTPLGPRQIRTLALSPTSPLDILSASGPPTPFSIWRMRPEFSSKSPIARRHPLSPLKLRADIPDSPCRRATLSPCTPPPEAPYSAKSPMLVLQKRVDLAMNEIQELRELVQTLQSELKVKNDQLEVEHGLPDHNSLEPSDETPTTATATRPSAEVFHSEETLNSVVSPRVMLHPLAVSRFSSTEICLLFLLYCMVISSSVWEAAAHFASLFGPAIISNEFAAPSSFAWLGTI